MCELTAILAEGNDREKLMEDVIRIDVKGDEITITGIFGDTMTVRGVIQYVDITKQEALLKKT